KRGHASAARVQHGKGIGKSNMGRTILVVEDDEILAGNVCTYLARNGWEVENCGSAEEALKLIETLRPEAVVSDQNLPGLRGIEMLQKMREIDPMIKVILMTGDDSAQTAVQAMKAGAYDYVTKPVAMAELNLLLERAVGVKRMEQTLQFHQEREARGAGLKSLIGNSPVMR